MASLSRTLLSAGAIANINFWPLDASKDLSYSEITQTDSGRTGWIWRTVLIERTDETSLVIALSGRPSDVHFYDVASQTPLSAVCSGHTDHVHDIVYVPPSDLASPGLLFSSSSDLTVCIWKRPEVLGTKNFDRVGILKSHEGAVYAFSYAREYEPALFSCAFRVIRWNLARCVPVQLSPKVTAKADSLVRLKDRGLLAVGYSTGGAQKTSAVELFDERDLSAKSQFPLSACEVSSLLYHQERNQLIVTHRAGMMEYWDVRATSGGPVSKFQAHRYSMFGILRVGKTRFATASNDDTVRLWRFGSVTPDRTFSDHADQYGLCHCGGPIFEEEEMVPEDADDRLEFAETVSSCWSSVVLLGGGQLLRFPPSLALIFS